MDLGLASKNRRQFVRLFRAVASPEQIPLLLAETAAQIESVLDQINHKAAQCELLLIASLAHTGREICKRITPQTRPVLTSAADAWIKDSLRAIDHNLFPITFNDYTKTFEELYETLQKRSSRLLLELSKSHEAMPFLPNDADSLTASTPYLIFVVGSRKYAVESSQVLTHGKLPQGTSGYVATSKGLFRLKKIHSLLGQPQERAHAFQKDRFFIAIKSPNGIPSYAQAWEVDSVEGEVVFNEKESRLIQSTIRPSSKIKGILEKRDRNNMALWVNAQAIFSA